MSDSRLAEEEKRRRLAEEERKKDRVKTVTVIAARPAPAYTTEPTTGTLDIRFPRPKSAKAALGLNKDQSFVMYPTREDGLYILVRMERAVDAIGVKFLSPSDLSRLAAYIRSDRDEHMLRKIGRPPPVVRRVRRQKRS